METDTCGQLADKGQSYHSSYNSNLPFNFFKKSSTGMFKTSINSEKNNCLHLRQEENLGHWNHSDKKDWATVPCHSD